jgi:SPP1 family predicted phage head-tail adaptor
MKPKSTSYDVGQMKQFVELQSYTTTPDGMGGTTAEWESIGKVWADIQPVNGSERWEIESIKGNISHVVTIRYRALDNENRFVYNGRIFHIKYAIDKGEDGAYIKLAVMEEV